MSDAPNPEATPQGLESIRFSPDSGTAFTDLMEFLAPEPAEPEVPAGGEAPAAPADGGGAPAAPVQGAPATAPQPAAPAGGAAGGAAVPGAAAVPATGADAPGGAAAPGANVPGDAAAEAPDATVYDANWGAVTTALEERQTATLQQAALTEVKAEHSKYFEAIEQHPRQLVGQDVPSLDGSGGTERLRDSQDAKDWQDAVKAQLVAAVKDRMSRKADDLAPVMETLHSSIALFQNNPDLIPGTKQFDSELANEFVDFAKGFEVRSDGKLIGYSVPVQPILTKIRNNLVAARAVKGAQPTAAQLAAQQAAAQQQRNPAGQFSTDAPQAGLQNKAGSGAAEAENFDTLFAAIGLPPGSIRI